MKLTSNTWPLTHEETMLDVVAHSHGKEKRAVEKLRRVDILGRDGLWRPAKFEDIKKGMVFRLFDDNPSEFFEHGVPNVAAEDAYALEGINWGCKCDEVTAFTGAAPSPAPVPVLEPSELGPNYTKVELPYPVEQLSGTYKMESSVADEDDDIEEEEDEND